MSFASRSHSLDSNKEQTSNLQSLIMFQSPHFQIDEDEERPPPIPQRHDVGSFHEANSFSEKSEASYKSAKVTGRARNSDKRRDPYVTPAGAVAVTGVDGPREDSTLASVDYEEAARPEQAIVDISAHVVDEDKEAQLVEEQVNQRLQEEHRKGILVQAVPERFCDRRVALILVMAILAILAIALGVTLSKESAGTPPVPVPSQEEIADIISRVSFDGGDAMGTTGTPQNQAFHWLANDTFQGYYTDEKLIQRYSLATLYYSTNGQYWTNNSGWLDDGDECDRWLQPVGAINCNENGTILDLGLGSNNLNGSIPPEIGLMTTLGKCKAYQKQ